MFKDKVSKVFLQFDEFLGKPRGSIKMSISDICSYLLVAFTVMVIAAGGKGTPILATLSLIFIFFSHSTSNRELEKLKELNKVV